MKSCDKKREQSRGEGGRKEVKGGRRGEGEREKREAIKKCAHMNSFRELLIIKEITPLRRERNVKRETMIYC